jgi:hypothetical protein
MHAKQAKIGVGRVTGVTAHAWGQKVGGHFWPLSPWPRNPLPTILNEYLEITVVSSGQ